MVILGWYWGKWFCNKIMLKHKRWYGWVYMYIAHQRGTRRPRMTAWWGFVFVLLLEAATMQHTPGEFGVSMNGAYRGSLLRFLLPFRSWGLVIESRVLTTNSRYPKDAGVTATSSWHTLGTPFAIAPLDQLISHRPYLGSELFFENR